MPLPLPKRYRMLQVLPTFEVSAPVDDRQVRQLMERFSTLRHLLVRSHVDADAAIEAAATGIVEAGFELSLGLLVRTLEERHLQLLAMNGDYRARLVRLLGFRWRGASEALRAVRQRERVEHAHRRAVQHTMATTAAECPRGCD